MKWWSDDEVMKWYLNPIVHHCRSRLYCHGLHSNRPDASPDSRIKTSAGYVTRKPEARPSSGSVIIMWKALQCKLEGRTSIAADHSGQVYKSHQSGPKRCCSTKLQKKAFVRSGNTQSYVTHGISHSKAGLTCFFWNVNKKKAFGRSGTHCAYMSHGISHSKA